MQIRNPFSCFVVGDGTLAIRCAEVLLQKGHLVHGVVSSTPSVSDWARARGLACFGSPKDILATAQTQPFDYLFSIGYLSILNQQVLSAPRRFAINFHDALLPKYAGLHATSWALLNHERRHGVTWHIMTDRPDEGDVLKQRSVEVASDETAFSLNVKCYEAGFQVFIELVEDLAQNHATGTPQDLNQRTYFGKFKRPDAAAILSWHTPGEDLDASVRALDFGGQANPLASPKAFFGDELFIVSKLELLSSRSNALPGTILEADANRIQVATRTCDVRVSTLLTLSGEPRSLADIMEKAGLSVGSRLPELDSESAGTISGWFEEVCRHETFWEKRIETLTPLEVPYAALTTASAQNQEPISLEMEIPAEAVDCSRATPQRRNLEDLILAAFGGYMARLGATQQFDVAFEAPHAWLAQRFAARIFASEVPLRFTVDESDSFDALCASVEEQRHCVHRHHTFARDLIHRSPALRAVPALRREPFLPVKIRLVPDIPVGPEPLGGHQLILSVSVSQSICRWTFDRQTLRPEDAHGLVHGFEAFLKSVASTPSQLVREAPLISREDRQALLSEWNETGRSYDRTALIHRLFEQQAERTPDHVAVVFENQELTYSELNSKANQLARHLKNLGVGPEALVGICLDRSPEVLIALLGILKVGGAYVPLDPSYPSARLALMVEDCQARVICTRRRLRPLLAGQCESLVCLDTDWADIATQPSENLPERTEAANLAYVIYTSGSTGKPKGVMVTHRNVVNFFTGMDQKLGSTSPGVWLAVTSISFDISVLELLWTLSRGFKVILSAGQEGGLNTYRPAQQPTSQKPLEFSLFYWDLAASQGATGLANYKLLFETAKFADQNGFTAVWTPERHFHAFGGLYPNPSVVSAALAARTEHIQIRAGSLVLPLHHPIRVAEDWALVDNLSQGRVGLAVAAGWHSNDFVLAPQNHSDRKKILLQSLETVRKLWRGEIVEFLGPKGEKLHIQTLPRPVQPELPIWLSAAGNVETYRLAGEIGANILTHLLGQTLEELAEKLAVYRAAWRANGHGPRGGRVTLMLHTFIGEDDEETRELVRRPLKAYLRSALALVGKNAWSFPTTGQVSSTSAKEIDRAVDSLGPEEIEAMLDHAFERYYATSGLLGGAEACLKMIDRLKAIDVDELACLIDFGLSFEPVMRSLEHLNALRSRTNPAAVPAQSDFSIAALIKRHRVTHLQCTPSLMRCLIADAAAAESITSIKTLLLGGEALQPPLYAQLRQRIPGEIFNMYGPTETTVWSTCAKLGEPEDRITIGRPIANTEVLILDRYFQPVPVGLPGELFIGGEGVARGYLHRPELTAERFVRHPFSPDQGARLYRTGDLARYLPDGRLEFLGRADQQVKIRGCRVELGEIELLLAKSPGVREAVAMVREDAPGDQRIVAYLVPDPAQTISIRDVRTCLQDNLPECMMPSAFVVLPALPLTPNGKLDRKALPVPDADRPQVEASFEAPVNSIEEALAEIWAQALHIERVGRNDNFFELGGHSLSAIQITFRIRQTCSVELPLQTFFRMPTLAALADAIQDLLLEQASDDNLEQLVY